MKNKRCIFVCVFIFTAVFAFGWTTGLKEDTIIPLDTISTGSRHFICFEAGEQDILSLINGSSSFGMYKDNYFITGIPSNEKIDKHTADVKFQISIQQRLTNTTLPFNSYLLLTYSQKSFWKFYEASSPFEDSNYNPALVWTKPFVKNNRLKGMTSLSIEHESNGQSGEKSRSANFLSLNGLYFFNSHFSIQGKVWAGWLSEMNKDLYRKYRGYGLLAVNYKSSNHKFWVSAVAYPREKIGNFNTQLEINFKLSSKTNQYMFIQWYQGYGESLLYYNKYSSMVRAGICMKPNLWNIY